MPANLVFPAVWADSTTLSASGDNTTTLHDLLTIPPLAFANGPLLAASLILEGMAPALDHPNLGDPFTVRLGVRFADNTTINVVSNKFASSGGFNLNGTLSLFGSDICVNSRLPEGGTLFATIQWDDYSSVAHLEMVIVAVLLDVSMGGSTDGMPFFGDDFTSPQSSSSVSRTFSQVTVEPATHTNLIMVSAAGRHTGSLGIANGSNQNTYYDILYATKEPSTHNDYLQAGISLYVPELPNQPRTFNVYNPAYGDPAPSTTSQVQQGSSYYSTFVEPSLPIPTYALGVRTLFGTMSMPVNVWHMAANAYVPSGSSLDSRLWEVEIRDSGGGLLTTKVWPTDFGGVTPNQAYPLPDGGVTANVYVTRVVAGPFHDNTSKFNFDLIFLKGSILYTTPIILIPKVSGRPSAQFIH